MRISDLDQHGDPFQAYGPSILSERSADIFVNHRIYFVVNSSRNKSILHVWEQQHIFIQDNKHIRWIIVINYFFPAFFGTHTLFIIPP